MKDGGRSTDRPRCHPESLGLFTASSVLLSEKKRVWTQMLGELPVLSLRQAVTFVSGRNRFIQCPCPSTGDRKEEEICPLGAPRLWVEARKGPRRVSNKSGINGHQLESGSFVAVRMGNKTSQKSLVSQILERGQCVQQRGVAVMGSRHWGERGMRNHRCKGLEKSPAGAGPDRMELGALGVGGTSS